MAAKISKNETNKPGLSEKLAAAGTYFEESKIELKKVTWPTKAEVKVTTFAVLILVVVMSIFLGIVDFGLANLIKLITSLGM